VPGGPDLDSCGLIQISPGGTSCRRSHERNCSAPEELIFTIVDGRPVTIAGQDQAGDTHDRYNALGFEQKLGRRYVAWVARAVDSAGNVVAVYASIPSYEKYGYAKVE
jgi:hypothetical protein